MEAAYTAAQVRRLEESAMSAVAGDTLMQRAAHGLAVAVAAELRSRLGRVYGARVLVLVGPGNNGGDALFAGARLARRGASVRASAALGEPHGPGLSSLLAAGGRLLQLDELEDGPAPDLVIDGVLGIGGRPGLPPTLARIASHLADRRVPTVAADLPSGVDTDTGQAPAATFRASRTVTFGVLKPCHLLEPARSRCGRVDLVAIGLDVFLEEPALLAWGADDVALRWPYPDEGSDKYSRGVLAIDTGSQTYPGAAILNTYGAVHAGAGMVRFLGPQAAAEVISAQLPNVVLSPGRAQAHLLGSGWGDREDGASTVAAAVATGLPVLVDADGLRYLPDSLPETCLLTPHAGELARLVGCTRGEVQADPVAAVRRAADLTGATVLLKGASQLVARPGSAQVAVAVGGPAWTAQAGSGDTLAGSCGTLLAAGVPAFDAALLGASLQALTATTSPGPVPPHALAQRGAEMLGRLRQRRSELRALGL